MTYELYKPYKTRGGWKAVYLGVDCDGDHVWVHYTEGQIFAICHCASGSRFDGSESVHDIISEWKEPVVHEGWVNVVLNDPKMDRKFHLMVFEQYDTKEEADQCAQDRIACIHIKFTEGEGL